MIVPPRVKDITGMAFGEMTVVSFAGYSNPGRGRRRLLWRIKCSCGAEKDVLSTTLRNTKVKSCGHLRGVVVLPNNEASVNLRMHQYKANAGKMGREFSLSREQFKALLLGNCVYCGSPPSSVVKARGKYQTDFWYNGIDRVDNRLGYTAENCAPCCTKCNLMKRSWPVDEFLDHIRKIANHHATGDCPKPAN